MPAPPLRLLALAACLLIVAACTGTPPMPRRAGLPEGVAGAADALAALPVTTTEPAGPYRRARFGDGWADLDSDGCSTRQEILRRDLREVRTRATSSGCTVESGVLSDPYSGVTVRFRYGPSTSADVQIDHVVALADAWRSGASTWTGQRRVRFANDPLELLAVEGGQNQDKGARTAADWLPPAPEERCDYVARQVAIKRRWQLSVARREREVMTRVLAGCPGQQLPSR